jgi:hypothetical protein
MTSESEKIIPPYKNLDTSPFIYFDVVPTFGVLNGAIQIELAARILIPGEGQDVHAEFVSVGRLRCSPTAAEHLRTAVQKSLEMLNQPQAPLATATKLN